MQTRTPPKWVDILITLVGLVGFGLVLIFWEQAFPTAALKLELSRSEVIRLAQDTLKDYGLEDYQFALEFSEASSASMYLQLTLGIPEANRLIQAEKLPIWYWHARWFRPLQKEEFSLYLAPDGRVVGFYHVIEESAAGASLEQDQAQNLAEKYLEERQWSLDQWEMISASSEERPGGRVDHDFTWKRRNFDIDGGELRILVSVQGDQIGGYDYWLKVPEAFSRDFSTRRNRAAFVDNISTLLGYIFLMAAFAAVGWGLVLGTRPRRVAWLVALAVGLMSLLTTANEFPLYGMSYNTTKDYAQFWFEICLYAVMGTLFIAAYIFIIWMGGERLSRLVWPRQDRVLNQRGDVQINLARSAWRGLMLAGWMGAYVVIFYLIATHLLGGWTPMDTPYSDLYATPFPFLAPLFSGLFAAVDEEVLYRWVGIGLLLGLTRRRWLAVLIPAVLWGFAHATYIREPFYLRGIEVTLAGVFLLGLFFLYFDLTTTIIAHMTYNAALSALPMLLSGEPYFVFCGLVVLLVLAAPVAPGLWRMVRRRWRGDVLQEPQVCAATSDDLPGLEKLPDVLAAVEGANWQTLLADAQAVVFCLKVGDQVVGAAAGRVDGEDGTLLAVYIDPAWRGQYWGSELTDAVRAQMEMLGAHSIQARVVVENHTASAFLASQGWRSKMRIFSAGPLPTFQLAMAEVCEQSTTLRRVAAWFRTRKM